MRDLFATLCLAGAIQAFFLSIVLIYKKEKRSQNLYPALFLIFMAIDGVELYLSSKGLLDSPRPYQLSIIPYSFIFGPSVYLYTISLTGRIKHSGEKKIFMYSPFAVFLTANILLYNLYDAEHIPGVVIHLNILINAGGLLTEIALYILSLFILQKYKLRLKKKLFFC